MPDSDAPVSRVPEARTVPRKRTRFSLVWTIPLVAAVVGVWVAATRILNQGPTITIVFKTAEGLEAGKTKIHYNGVDVGTISTIRLSDDHQHVILQAQMAPKTEGFLVDDTQFWVVSPRISGANVTGLGTLISGSYIGMEIGQSHQSKREFTGLDAAPVVTGEVPGRFFQLRTRDLGSLDIGTPIYFRRLQVGQVASYALDQDGQSLTLKIFVNTPYDQYVNASTRFWQASGVDVSLSASGLTVQTQSLLSILVGGIAFETPATGPVLPEAASDTLFTLFDDRENAFRPPVHDPQIYMLVFKDSVRGLSVGAPVELHGIPVGEVTDISAQIDVKTMEFSVPVTVRVDAQRLGVKVLDLPPDVPLTEVHRKLVDSMVAHGVRAQLQTGNLLTGALYVSLDFFPDAPAAVIDWSQTPPLLPTIPGQIQVLENSVASIIRKLDQVPIKAIGDDLRNSLAELDKTLVTARASLGGADKLVDNAGKLVEPNSVLESQLSGTLQEVSAAARSLRVLMDYLERHPEALLRGKTEEAK